MAGCHHTDTDGVVPDEMVFYYASALGPGVTVDPCASLLRELQLNTASAWM